jgi:hypothetical protein
MDLYYFDEGYYTPELGYFVYVASGASALNTTATVTAAPGAIRQFFERAVTGITVDGTHHVEYQDAELTGAWSSQTVISMWVRKHRSTSQGTLLHNIN